MTPTDLPDLADLGERPPTLVAVPTTARHVRSIPEPDRARLARVIADHNRAVHKLRDILCAGCYLVIGHPGYAPTADLVAAHQVEAVLADLRAQGVIPC